MKHPIKTIIALFFVIAVGFQSCKKELKSINSKSDQVDISGCKVTRHYNEVSGEKYIYDSIGRILTIEVSFEGEIYGATNYSYEPGKVKYVISYSHEKGEHILDSTGKVIKSTILYYKWDDTINVKYYENLYYKYNSNGNLIEKEWVVFGRGDSIVRTSSVQYLWENGNMISTIFKIPGADPSITIFDYYTDKENFWAATKSAVEFTGVQSKNLFKSNTNVQTGVVNPTYFYQFSSNGMPLVMDYGFRIMNLEFDCNK